MKSVSMIFMSHTKAVTHLPQIVTLVVSRHKGVQRYVAP